MSRYQRVVLWFLAYPLFFAVSAGYADKIFLKDGTVQESERVWQSESYVHFILRGTQGVVIRYSRGIVHRVLIDGVEEIIDTQEGGSGSAKDASVHPKEAAADKDPISAGSPAGIKAPTRPKAIDRKFIHSHKGVSFYDPRRRFRYWATNDSKHRSLEAALKVLAQTYGQSVKWIEHHMGEENDLGIIHKNLMTHQESGPKSQVERANAQPASGRQQPAISKSTVLGAPGRSAEITSTQRRDQNSQGVAFYNPRRKVKYWTGKGKRYNSLDDALHALAQQYGVAVEWVERHMGDTNDLMQIHQNLQISLNPKK